MSTSDVVVLAAAVVVILGLGWFFFGPRRALAATLTGGVQRVEVTVHGGYQPEVIEVRQGLPVELVFDRQESGDCTARVVFPDLGISAALPAYSRTTVRLDPARPGTFPFACGMNMIHGSLVVRPGNGPEHEAPTSGDAETSTPQPTAAPARDATEEEAAQARERRAEITDLARRVVVGAVLTLPVLVAVMAHDVFGADWVPGVLLDRWVQLALITPVMLYTGWRIHRTGWLSLAHRNADMNSLITLGTLGTLAAYGYSLLVTVAPGLLPEDVREVYFEAVGVILTLIVLWRLLEARAKAGTGEAIRALPAR